MPSLLVPEYPLLIVFPFPILLPGACATLPIAGKQADTPRPQMTVTPSTSFLHLEGTSVDMWGITAYQPSSP
ncbi:hypothetical protein EDB85DRAFT_2023739 [Lactarius pseudohatsudake]|nr:hypothetical protein EDB85DRAFT_2023739 [Lactarius pseudohatsudake]